MNVMFSTQPIDSSKSYKLDLERQRNITISTLEGFLVTVIVCHRTLTVKMTEMFLNSPNDVRRNRSLFHTIWGPDHGAITETQRGGHRRPFYFLP